MKNIYKKHCDIFLKSSKKANIHIQRDNGFYYISDGFTILTVKEGVYNEFIAPLSDVFIPLHDGYEAIKRCSSGHIDIVQNSSTLKRIYDTASAEAPTQLLPLMLEDRSSKKSYQLVKVRERVLGYNAAYIDAAADYLCGAEFTGGGGDWPVIKGESAFGGCLIMPCNCSSKLSSLLKTLRNLKP